MEINLHSFLEGPVSSPPSIFIKLQKALKDQETTYDEIELIICADSGLTARTLKIVNSSFYGFSGKIGSISHAINIIGTEKLSELALTTLVIEKFQGIPKNLISMNLFWKHSIACGLGSKFIAELRNFEEPDRYYLCGLLHDIGSLLFYKQIPGKSRLLLNEARKRKINLFLVEKENLGINHAELGGALLEKWRLPQNFVEASKFHHDPMKANSNSQYALVVHLADILAYELELGSSGEPLFLF